MVEVGATIETTVKELFLEHSEAVLAFFRRNLSMARRDAQDLLQQTFLELLKSLSKDPDRQLENPRAFVLGIARHNLFAYLNKHQREPVGSTGVDMLTTTSEMREADDAEYLATLDSHYRLLLRAMRRLQDVERTPPVGTRGKHRVSKLQLILYLRRWEHLTIAQVSQVLEIPEGTVASSQRRALEQMEKLVGTLEAPTDVARTSTAVLRSWWHLLEDEAKKAQAPLDDDD